MMSQNIPNLRHISNCSKNSKRPVDWMAVHILDCAPTTKTDGSKGCKYEGNSPLQCHIGYRRVPNEISHPSFIVVWTVGMKVLGHRFQCSVTEDIETQLKDPKVPPAFR